MPKVPPSRRPRAQKRARTATARQVATAKREAEILHLRSVGLTFREIGENLGISHHSAESGFYRALRNIPESDAQTERMLQGERIAKLRKRVWAMFEGDGTACPQCGLSPNRLAAAAQLVRLEERQSRLLGLDSPIKVDVSLGAPMKFHVDNKSRSEALEKLSVEEQRTLLLILRKMRGEPPYPIGPFVQTNGHAPEGQPALPPAAHELVAELRSGRRIVEEEDE